jgi:hypothetical protein
LDPILRYNFRYQLDEANEDQDDLKIEKIDNLSGRTKKGLKKHLI